MIQVTINQNREGQCIGFVLKGHAGFAAYGEDIVCSAVSVLVLNTINAIDAFTEDVFEHAIHQEKDVVSFSITSGPVSHDAQLLLNSMVLGLEQIAKEYGKKYITLKKRKQEV